MNRILRSIVFLLLAAYSFNGIHADVARENKIKAAYIYHIINFVQWPDQAAKSTPRNRINVCLVGDETFKSSLAPLTRNSISAYEIDVVVNHSPNRVGACQVLYFANTTMEQTRELIAQTCGHPILTLGDAPGFAQAGGMIGFVVHENNVRLDVNIHAVNRAGFSISAKLLEIALNIIKNPTIDCP
jgi:hypothetical protein